MPTTLEREINCCFNNKATVPDSLSIVEHDYKAKESEHSFHVMTPEDGDKRIVWNSRSIAEINDAKKMFNDLISNGFLPYRIKDGKPSKEVMREFDPHSGEVMMIEDVVFVPQPAIAGG